MTNTTTNKIFGIGLSKTGTTSLCQAMRILDYTSKHYLINPDIEIKQYEFLNDMPIQTRYQQYDKQYPGSKFILTIREKQSWLRSCSKHFGLGVKDKDSILYRYRVEQMNIDYYDENIFSKKYDDHIKNVDLYFKQRKEDLLLIDICGGQGWKELCIFLNLPIPDVQFPRTNVAKT